MIASNCCLPCFLCTDLDRASFRPRWVISYWGAFGAACPFVLRENPVDNGWVGNCRWRTWNWATRTRYRRATVAERAAAAAEFYRRLYRPATIFSVWRVVEARRNRRFSVPVSGRNRFPAGVAYGYRGCLLFDRRRLCRRRPCLWRCVPI